MSLRTPLMLIGAALLLAAAPAAAQQAPDCPEVKAEDGRPIELRIGGIVLRAQVSEQPAHEGGTSVDVRLVGCEEARAEGEAETDADAAARAGDAAASGILRVLHDLRFGVDLGPSEDGRCMRARFDLRGDRAAAGEAEGVLPSEPLSFELCGLPFGRTPRDEGVDPAG